MSCEAPSRAELRRCRALTATERRRGKRVLAISCTQAQAAQVVADSRVTVTVGERAFSVPGGQTDTIFVGINATGRALLAKFHELPATLKVTLANGASEAPTLVSASQADDQACEEGAQAAPPSRGPSHEQAAQALSQASWA